MGYKESWLKQALFKARERYGRASLETHDPKQSVEVILYLEGNKLIQRDLYFLI